MVTTMDIKNLMELGLTKNESTVYLSLIKFGKADARLLIKDTKLHKKVVYENIERIIDKGLAGFIVDNGRRVFQLNPSNSLVNFFEDRILEEENKKRMAEKIAEEINKTQKTISEKKEAIIYRGKQGVRTLYRELLEVGEDYVVFGAPEKSLQIMDELFWRNFNSKRKEKQMGARLLFNTSLKKYGDSIKDSLTKVKFFEKDFEPLTETNIQKDRVAIIVWSDEPILFIITDKIVVESYKAYFEKI